MKLSRDECLNMVKTKKCETEPMTCEGDSCTGSLIPNDNYVWMSIVRQVGYKCSFWPKILNTATVNDVLFGSTSHPCKALDFECYFHDSIVAWDKSVIHEYPFELYTVNTFKLDENVLINTKEHLLFRLTDTFTQCGTTIYGTMEGLYFTAYTDRVDSTFRRNDNFKEIQMTNQLILADEDFSSYNTFKLFRQLNYQSCHTITTILKQFSK